MTEPTWLTANYLENILRGFYKDSTIKVAETIIKPALGKGENYGGVLTRVKINYSLEHLEDMQVKYLIVKTDFENDPQIKELMAPYDVVNREMGIYERVLPKLTQYLRSIGDEEVIFPTALHVDYERKAIVFEDLSQEGFIMADRIKRLDLDHTLLILRKLAKMHATSAILNERCKGCLESYDKGFFNRYTENYKNYFVGSIIAFAKYLKKKGGSMYYAEKLDALVPHFMEVGKRCFEPTSGHVNVLAHGDVWTNNVMFKYDARTKKPIDVIIIDFQYACWGSPALDLHHFFNTSLQEDLRLNEQDYLTQYYHEIFTKVLKNLRYSANPIPNLHRFRSQVEEKRFFAVYASFVAQPVMINENTEDADFMALVGDSDRSRNFKEKLYYNPVVEGYTEKLLPFFDRKGLLEVNQCN